MFFDPPLPIPTRELIPSLTYDDLARHVQLAKDNISGYAHLRDALKQAQDREEKALEQNQKQEERNIEQRYEALKAGVDPKAASQMTAMAVVDITSARCAREQRCGNIGADKTYASLDACSTKLSSELQEEINGYDCSKGVVGKELQECLTAIREEECNAPFEKLARIAACRDSDICNN